MCCTTDDPMCCSTAAPQLLLLLMSPIPLSNLLLASKPASDVSSHDDFNSSLPTYRLERSSLQLLYTILGSYQGRLYLQLEHLRLPRYVKANRGMHLVLL